MKTTSSFPDIVYIALLVLTALNFSVFTFDFSGEFSPSEGLKRLAYLRFPLVAIGAVYVSAIHRKPFSYIFSQYRAIFVFLGILSISLATASDLLNATLYTLWFISQCYFLLVYSDYLITRSDTRRAALKLLAPLAIFCAYFLVLSILKLSAYSPGKPFPAYYTSSIIPVMLAQRFYFSLAIF